jgi:PAS domain S-box-containing protein
MFQETPSRGMQEFHPMDELASADPNIHATILEVISEGISGAVLVYDKNDLILFASQQVLALLPVPRQFLAPGTRLRDFLGAVYDENGRLALETATAARRKEKAEFVERRGTDRWISFTKRRLSSGHGVCIMRDITEQKKREEKWHADMERVQVTEEVLDNLPFTVTVKDANHTFVAVNKAACRFHNKTAESILGNKGQDFQPQELRERLEAINNHVLDTGDLLQLPERLTRADGSQSIVVANKFRIGKPGRYYVVTTMQDLTRFLSISSTGEIKPVLGWDEFISLSLRRDDGGADSPAVRLKALESRKILIASAGPDMEREAVAALSGLNIDTSSVSSADELTLFLHLASEAEIGVDLVIVDSGLGGPCAEIAAAHGVPTLQIDPDKIASLLLTAVVDCFGDFPGGGTTAVPPDGWEVVEEGRDEAIDILVAEDNEVNQIVFSQILEGLGYRYAIATDGEQAVQLWQDRAPSLILMDITLPLLNGFEAAALIRAQEEGPRVPIIGVLPQAFDRDRDECFNCGMDDVILKPISPEALQVLFARFIPHMQRPAALQG